MKFYVNGNKHNPKDHVEVRAIIAKQGFNVDDFGPDLNYNPQHPLQKRKVLKTETINGFELKFIEPSGYNLVGMNEMVEAKLPSILYQRI
jgi:hypothetical protein